MQLTDISREYYDYLVGVNRNFEAQIHFLDKIFKKHGVKTILDCGCGTATHTIMLAKKGYKLTAFDYSKHQINIAKKKAKKHKLKIHFKTGDIRNFDFGKFDAVISLYSVLMFACKDKKDLDNSIKCMKNSLNTNGIAFFETSTPIIGKSDGIAVHKYACKDFKVARITFYEETSKKNLTKGTYNYILKEKKKKPKITIAESETKYFTKTDIEKSLKKNKLKIIKLYGSLKNKSYEDYTKASTFISPLFKLR